jgi:putative oxidoreductase
VSERDSVLNAGNAHTFILLAARLVVGGIFLLASVPKIQSPGAFADAVRAFHLLPPSLVLPFSFVVPWLELLVGLYLVVGFMSRLGGLGSIVLLGTFVVALLDALLTGNTAHACGCFGSAGNGNVLLSFLAGGNTVTWWDVVRDVILALLSALVVWWGPGAISVEGFLTRRRAGSMEESAA